MPHVVRLIYADARFIPVSSAPIYCIQRFENDNIVDNGDEAVVEPGYDMAGE